MAVTVGEIAQLLSARLTGDAGHAVTGIAPPHLARADDLALAMTPETAPALTATAAKAVVVAGETEIPEGRFAAVLSVARPRLALSALTARFAPQPHAPVGIHPSAVVAADAEIGEDVSIGPFVVVGAGARIGARGRVLSHVSIGAGAMIGAEALLHPGVRIGDRCVLGARAIVHANASIGADGFSFVTPEPGSVESAKATGRIEATNVAIRRIASLGIVEIGDDVEIGAGTTIDRATLEATRIGNGTKIDNLVQIGHNVTIGENCLICGMVGISGSCRIGDRVVIGGGAGLADHVTVGDDAMIMAQAGVPSRVHARTIVGGAPAVQRDRFVEQIKNIGRITLMRSQIAALKDRVAALEGGGLGPADAE